MIWGINMKKLILCENCKLYKQLDKSLLWDFYITNSVENSIKYICHYHPGSILISYQKLENFDEIMSYVKKEYKDFPSVFICTRDGILSSITDDTSRRYIVCVDKIPIQADLLISEMLMKYCFSPKHKGFTYIKRAMYEGLVNDGVYTNIKKLLYPNIATMYLTSDSSVERSISFAIFRAYEKSEEMRQIFHNEERYPTNLNFLRNFFILLKHSLPAEGFFES